jgi:hypothetical protein
LGHLLALFVTPVNEQERAWVGELAEAVQEVTFVERLGEVAQQVPAVRHLGSLQCTG